MGWPQLSLRPTDVTSVASVSSISRAVFAALLCFGVGLATEARAEALEKQPLTFLTASGKHRITVEVADSDQERSTGLMFRKSIGDEEGMIFIYPQDEPISMWMKNTYISLDMIFVRSDGTVQHIAADTEPFSEATISSGEKVRAVIEMKAGSAKRLDIKSGDKVDYPTFH
jgi:uncharacterized membrane protein (UPF0127 family)